MVNQKGLFSALLGLMLMAGTAFAQSIPSTACNYGASAPPNDDVCGAIEVTPDVCFDGCNSNADDDTAGQGVGADCQSHGNNVDVFYHFVADSTGFQFHVYHDTTIWNGTDSVYYDATTVDVILYRQSSFSSCDPNANCGDANACNYNDLVGMACWEDDGTRDLEGSTAGILTPGEDYWFLVSSATVSSHNPGGFLACFSNTPTLPPADACTDAQTLCDNTSFHESDAGFVPQENITTNTCMGSTRNQVKWYQVTFATDGTFGFLVTPDGPDDYDFLAWANTGPGTSPCNSVMPTPDYCNWSGCDGPTGISNTSNDCTGPPSNYDAIGDAGAGSAPLGPGLATVNAGDTWTILIDNWSSGSGFTFDFAPDMTALVGPQADFTLMTYDCTPSALNVEIGADYITPGFTYGIDWGDGTSTAADSGSHTYTASGDYIIRLTVSDTNSTTTCLRTAEVLVSCILDVEMNEFTGRVNGDYVDLAWTTARETDSEYFEVQRSRDGENWNEIGRVNGRGFTTSKTEYNFSDIAPMAGVNHYRLKVVNQGGGYSYSEVLTFNFGDVDEVYLVRVVNLLGQEVKGDMSPGQVYIYIYSDGSTEKKVFYRN